MRSTRSFERLEMQNIVIKKHSLSVLPLIDNREDAEWSATCGTVLYEFLAIRIDAQTVVIEIVLTLANGCTTLYRST